MTKLKTITMVWRQLSVKRGSTKAAFSFLFSFFLFFGSTSSALAAQAVWHEQSQLVSIDASNSAGVSQLLLNDVALDFSQPIKLINTGELNTGLGDVPAKTIIVHVSAGTPLANVIEVVGVPADVVVVTQGNMLCQGCEFRNAARVVLATGRTSISSNGALT